MNQISRKLINDFSPMWTNKQIWEFEQLNENLTFDALYAEPGDFVVDSWNSKLANPDSDIQEMIVRTFDHLADGKELWIAKMVSSCMYGMPFPESSIWITISSSFSSTVISTVPSPSID